ncbi:MAG: RNA 2',3'-cyclic phosphodiesterase [Hydrogenibacillus sp.]|nr:RNA 2',3'-cyclic phosphodiesterase [Hydrogenibacillus sp.]
MLRLFLALPVDPEVKAALARFVDDHRPHLPFKRFVDAEDYHVTVDFIGAVPEARLDSLLSAVDKAREKRPGSVRIRLEALRGFGPQTAPRVLVVRTALQPFEPFVAFREALGTALHAAGFTVDRSRPYRPHITLAREGTGPASDAIALPPLAYTAGTLVLYRSDLHRRPMYTALHAWPL